MTTPKFIDIWQTPAPGAIPDAPSEYSDGEGDSLRVHNVNVPTICPYLASGDKNRRSAVVICPGGGYGILAINKEGHDIARWFNSFGVSAFVLKYRMSPYRHPVPLMDAQQAIRIVRERAGSWSIDPEQIGIMGFSAGGHLASTVATHYEKPTKSEGQLADVSCRPDFVILGYPVISFIDPELTHKGSRNNLLGERGSDDGLREDLSAECSLLPDAPPAFLFHAEDDRCVPIGNSKAYCKAMAAIGRPAELCSIAEGGHGFGSLIDEWMAPCRRWIERNI